MTATPELRTDLDEVIEHSADDLRSFRNARIFITGGTGFIGTWLLESIAHANRILDTNIHAVVLTRSPDAFQAKRSKQANRHPQLAGAGWLTFVRGDVRKLPSLSGTFDAVIHAATPASAKLNAEQPLEMLDTIVEGGHNVLDLAAKAGKIPFLLTSSGAVYGRQPADISHLTEAFTGAPDTLDPNNAYHEGKRIAELQCAIYARKRGLQCKIARLFAFSGPYLPLDAHFAIGNFLANALRNEPIHIKGDGTAVRSYLYASDMVSWLWAVLARGETLRPYNIGSSHAVNIKDLAACTARLVEPNVPITILGEKGVAADCYVPNVDRIVKELGVRETVSLQQALKRTFSFFQQTG